jgi:hypothetical protein
MKKNLIIVLSVLLLACFINSAEEINLENPKLIKEINLEEALQKDLFTENQKTYKSLDSKQTNQKYLTIIPSYQGNYNDLTLNIKVDIYLLETKPKDDIFYLNVIFEHNEGSYPETTIEINDWKKRLILAKNVYLLYDQQKYFLLFTGSYSIKETFSAEVFRISYTSDREGHYKIGRLISACRGFVGEYPWDDMSDRANLNIHTSKNADIQSLINTLYSAKTEIVTWSKNNYNCFIDFNKFDKK